MSKKCVVCSFESNEKNPALTESYQGKTYSFCCPLCHSTFKTLPDQFAK